MKNSFANPNTKKYCEILDQRINRRYLSIFLIGLILCAFNLLSISAQTSTINTIEKIKTYVSKRGTGEKSKVIVKMKDGRKLKGFISQNGEDSFELTNSKTKQIISVAYRDVTQVRKQGLSTGAKIAIGVGIAAVVTVVVLAVAVKNSLDDLGPISICCGP